MPYGVFSVCPSVECSCFIDVAFFKSLRKQNMTMNVILDTPLPSLPLLCHPPHSLCRIYLHSIHPYSMITTPLPKRPLLPLKTQLTLLLIVFQEQIILPSALNTGIFYWKIYIYIIRTTERFKALKSKPK